MIVRYEDGYKTYLMQIGSIEYDARRGQVVMFGVRQNDSISMNCETQAEFDSFCEKLVTNKIVNLLERRGKRK